MNIPILICIPYWKGDHAQATELCRIIAGLQVGHAAQTAHVMLISRQDMPMDPNMVKIISAKFNTHTFRSPSPLRGWPSGPNGMFGTTMIHVANQFSKIYECVFWMEPDCVPLKPNWFWDLVLEWRRKHPNAKIVGCRHDCDGNGKGDHITGCALYDPSIARIMPSITRCDNIAWDYALRDRIVAIGGSTNLIQNLYKQRNVGVNVANQASVSVVHGVKDRSLTGHVMKKHGIR